MDFTFTNPLEEFTPAWATRLITQLMVYFVLTFVSWLVISFVRSRPPADEDHSPYAQLARCCVLGYEPLNSQKTNGGHSEIATSGDVTNGKKKKTPKPGAEEGDGAVEIQKSTAVQAAMLTYATVGLMFSYLSWGVLQERVMTTDYTTGRFESSNFLVFSNRIFALLVAIPMMAYKGEGLGKAPFYKYAFTSLSNTLSSWCQLEALKFVSFPVQVLAKSSKMVPVMIMGRVLSGKRYPWYEYGIAAAISVGVALFLLSQGGGGGGGSGPQSTEFSGALLMLGYLSFDSFTSQWQDKLFKEYDLSMYQMMFGINAFSAAFTLVSLLQSGELFSSLLFLGENGEAFWHICGFSMAGALGQTFIFFTIKEFGPLVFTIITTVRQLIAIVLSVIIYGHSVEAQGMFGACLVFLAILYRVWVKEQEGKRAKEEAKRAKSSDHTSADDPEAGGVKMVGVASSSRPTSTAASSSSSSSIATGGATARVVPEGSLEEKTALIGGGGGGGNGLAKQ